VSSARMPYVALLVAVLALSACGGGSESPAADTSTVEEMTLPSGLTVRDYPKAMKWLNERLDACGADEPADEPADADYVWGCVDDGAVDACGDWVGTIDSDDAYYVECVEDMRYLAAEALADETVVADDLRAYRQEVEMRLPSGMTVRDYSVTVFDPEPMTWVRKQRKTCAASRVILSVENCINEGAIQVCARGNWFGGIDPENPKYTDCVEDMRYLAEKKVGG
jgi:hypothetical protein